MTEVTLRRVLTDLGLTDSEAEVYLFISKQGILTGTEISRLIKKDKGQVFRILKSLQVKGMAEATLEVPMRFTPVAFEKVLESSIKAKKDETEIIENAKEQLLEYWKGLNRKSTDVTLERFSIIEGRHKVYSKIHQLATEAKSHLSAVSSVSGLLRAEQFGVFDIPSNELRRNVQFRLLTELSNQNVRAVKVLLKTAVKRGFNFKGRNPDLGSSVFPRMVIRDNEEAVFFISPRTSVPSDEDKLCLWTNSRDLVRAFDRVFEDLWEDASDVQEKICEIEANKQKRKTRISSHDQTIKSKYSDILASAKTDVVMLTSPNGLIEFSKNASLIKSFVGKDVSLRIMAPIISENLKVVQELSKCCQVKHVSNNYLDTTIIDGKYLFQFKNAFKSNQEKSNSEVDFENAFYTDDQEYIEKRRSMLNDLWKNAKSPSFTTLESILNFPKSIAAANLSGTPSNAHEILKKVSGINILEEKSVTEKDILDKIINAKKSQVNDPAKDITRFYGFCGQAVIHPPKYFELPDVMIQAFHNDKQSPYGNEDYVSVYLWLQTPMGFAYVPVAIVGDVEEGMPGMKAVMAGMPAGHNIKIVKKEELQVQIHGNIFFVGWTVPIPLLPSQSVLPPSAVVLESYGDSRTRAWSSVIPTSGYKVDVEGNGCEAFVTFYHPSSKYSGPGTDGFVNRDFTMTITPP